jgi:hypothetical protein
MRRIAVTVHQLTRFERLATATHYGVKRTVTVTAQEASMTSLTAHFMDCVLGRRKRAPNIGLAV